MLFVNLLAPCLPPKFDDRDEPGSEVGYQYITKSAIFVDGFEHFLKNAMQRPGGAYFVNRHGTFWKEETFSFPEHQKILKSIKNPSQKMKKSEIFLKNHDFFENISY